MPCRNESNHWLKALLIGTFAGAVAGLLLAPQSGKDTQRQLKDEASRLQEEFDHYVAGLNEKSNEIKKDLEKRLNEVKELLSQKEKSKTSNNDSEV